MPTKVQLRLWKQLTHARDRGPALQFVVAFRYTKMFPKSAIGWVVLSESLVSTARYREATVALHKANRVVAPSQRWVIATRWGDLYRERNNWQWAERWYRMAIRLHPSAPTHIYLGTALAKQGKFLQAKRHHRLAIKLASDPKDVKDEAFLNLGLVLRAEGKYREAAMAFRKAIRITPKYKDARAALKDVEEAMRWRKTRRRIGAKKK
jgi:cytochrome c-type biogenesis protein CcmH/NrfG